MSSRVFVVADTHFGHDKIIEYCRPQYRDYIEMGEDLVYRWNQVVRPKDIVYHLGDVALAGNDDQRRDQVDSCLMRLNGELRLVAGNHDSPWIYQYFDHVYGVRERRIKGVGPVILSHIPVHRSQAGRFRLNIHGHLHDKEVQVTHRHGDVILQERDPFYICVSVEQTDYAPVPFIDLVKERLGQ